MRFSFNLEGYMPELLFKICPVNFSSDIPKARQDNDLPLGAYPNFLSA
jgi:hypothetical protein